MFTIFAKNNDLQGAWEKLGIEVIVGGKNALFLGECKLFLHAVRPTGNSPKLQKSRDVRVQMFSDFLTLQEEVNFRSCNTDNFWYDDTNHPEMKDT